MRRTSSQTFATSRRPTPPGLPEPKAAASAADDAPVESMRRALSFTTLADLGPPTPTSTAQGHLVLKLVPSQRHKAKKAGAPPSAPKLRPVDQAEDFEALEPLELDAPFLPGPVPESPTLSPWKCPPLVLPLHLPDALQTLHPAAHPRVEALKCEHRLTYPVAMRGTSSQAVFRLKALRDRYQGKVPNSAAPLVPSSLREARCHPGPLLDGLRGAQGRTLD